MHSRKDYNAIACQLRSFWEWFRLKVKKKKKESFTYLIQQLFTELKVFGVIEFVVQQCKRQTMKSTHSNVTKLQKMLESYKFCGAKGSTDGTTGKGHHVPWHSAVGVVRCFQRSHQKQFLVWVQRSVRLTDKGNFEQRFLKEMSKETMQIFGKVRFQVDEKLVKCRQCRGIHRTFRKPVGQMQREV